MPVPLQPTLSAGAALGLDAQYTLATVRDKITTKILHARILHGLL
jgi:hypothetical protein